LKKAYSEVEVEVEEVEIFFTLKSGVEEITNQINI
jgi:hypothetical protein